MTSPRILLLGLVIGCLLISGIWAGAASTVPSKASERVNAPVGQLGGLARAPHAGAVAFPPPPHTTANLTVVTVLPTYTILPEGAVPIDFYLNVTNASISPANVTLWVNVTDSVTGVICQNISLESLVLNHSGTSAAYEYDLGASTIGSEAALATKCPKITSEAVEFVFTARVDGNVSPIFGQNFTTSSNVSFLDGLVYSSTPGTSLVFAEPTETLGFANSATLNTYDLSANYTGQYVGRVALTVFSATLVGGSRTVLLAANLVRVAGVSPVAAWYEPRGGNYPYTLQLFTPYEVLNTSGVLAVTNATSLYYNTTNYDPHGLAGLDPAASAAMLLVVGLVVGFIVMWAVARWVLRPPAAENAPKQWSGAQGSPTPASGGQTCTFCGRIFATPEELTAHAKTEHGVE